MKRILVFAILALFTTSLSAQVLFEEGTLNQVIEKAKKENKKIFVDCYTSWCGPCKMLAKDIFPNEEVGTFMNDQFVNFKIDMEKGEGVLLMKKYNISVFPTLLILNSDGSEFSRTVGAAATPKAFIANITKLLTVDFEKMKERFKTSLEGANEYIQMLNDNYMIPERDKALVSVYNRRTAPENYNSTNFALYNNLITSIYHPVALSILNDGNNAIAFLGKKKYADFVDGKVSLTLTSMAMENSINRDKINELAVMSKKYKEMKTPLLNYFVKIANYIDDKNVEEIIAYSSKAFKSMSIQDREDIARFVHRVTVKNGQIEKLIPFYELCIAQSTNTNEIKRYNESLKLVKNLLAR